MEALPLRNLPTSWRGKTCRPQPVTCHHRVGVKRENEEGVGAEVVREPSWRSWGRCWAMWDK